MTKAQKRVLVVGLLLMAAAALFPPKNCIGGGSRGFLYSDYFFRPDSINCMKLVVEWMFLAALTGAGMLAVDRVVFFVNRWIHESSQALDIKPVDEEPEDADDK